MFIRGSKRHDCSLNVFFLCTVALMAAAGLPSAIAYAEEPDSEEDEEEEVEERRVRELPAAQAASPSSEPEKAAATTTAPPPPVPPPPAAAPSPFTFVLKGIVSGSLFAQNAPTPATGGALTFGAQRVGKDSWFLGGDVRQTRLTFTVKGPEVLSGGTPTGVIEIDLNGYNYQITPLGGLSAVVGAPDPAMPGQSRVVPLPYNTVTNEPRFDENLVAHLRVAYIELNWGTSQNVLRVGQYHNLLLGMIAGSAGHIATPLGYGAGQLGWRSPGITYLHRFKVSADTNLDIGLQVNRNSWRDELPTCAASVTTPTAGACLPYGVNHGEASLLPQVEARVMAFGGVNEAPLPFYMPTKWLAYLAGHWDMKDTTGVGNDMLPTTAAPAGQVYRNTMTTYVAQLGGKLQLGPVLIAANAWYGQNAGNVLGHIFQMQDLNRADVTGFGGWAQLGLGITRNLSIWGFAGTDKPNEKEAKAAAFNVSGTTRLQNTQIAFQLAYNEGPILIALEYLIVRTNNLIPGALAVNSDNETLQVTQPSVTMNYTF